MDEETGEAKRYLKGKVPHAKYQKVLKVRYLCLRVLIFFICLKINSVIAECFCTCSQCFAVSREVLVRRLLAFSESFPEYNLDRDLEFMYQDNEVDRS